MNIIIIWIIGFLFCLGITAREEENDKQKVSPWKEFQEELGMIFLLFVIWPHFLGYTFAEIIKTNKKKGKK